MSDALSRVFAALADPTRRDLVARLSIADATGRLRATPDRRTAMTTTSTHETVITADPEVPLIRMVREFDAPAAKVFRAHADPELFARWIGPDRNQVMLDVFDCRTGGAFRYRIGGDDGEFGFHGSFHDVREGELIVQTFTFDLEPDGVALEKLVFEDLDAGRCRLTSTSLCDSFTARDHWLANGMQEGVREGYRKLDELLAD